MLAVIAVSLPASDASREPISARLVAPPGCHVRFVAVNGLDSPLTVFERSCLADALDAFIRGQRLERVDPFGQILWPAACAASEALVGLCGSRRGKLQCLSVWELGAGLGLCLLVASALGASRVIATNASAEALGRVLAAADAQAPPLETVAWDFVAQPRRHADLRRVALGAHPALHEPLHMLVAAKCLFSEELADALARVCAEACADGGLALVADSVGLYMPLFLAALRTAAPGVAVSPAREVRRGWDAVPVTSVGKTRRYDAEV